MSQQSIPCPHCQTNIVFDPKLLVMGHSFNCSGCDASISLSTESTPVVKDALDKLDEIKRQAVNTAKPKQM